MTPTIRVKHISMESSGDGEGDGDGMAMKADSDVNGEVW